MNPLLVRYNGNSCAAAIIRPPGRIWSFKDGQWMDLPPDGRPTKDNVQVIERYAPAGTPYGVYWFWRCTIDPAELKLAVVAIHPLDTYGNILDPVDEYPWQWLRQIELGRGGWPD